MKFIMKRFPAVFLAVLLLFAAAAVWAADAPTPKEEVVYGILGADGGVQSIYVVNSFRGGEITDYGAYSAVRNMSGPEKLGMHGDMLTVRTSAERFTYQGTPEDAELPWNVGLNYKLDGKEVAATALAGRSGALEMGLFVTENEAAHPVFYKNYMLQVSLTLDTEKCVDIASPGATLARAGRNVVVNHTVMPGTETEIVVRADVRDFTMEGIEITALPPAMRFEMSETEQLIGEMVSLSDAVYRLNVGMRELAAGHAETYAGACRQIDGSAEFAAGLAGLSGRSEELRTAAAQIRAALHEMIYNGGPSEHLSRLAHAYDNFHGGLNAYLDGVDSLAAGYSELHQGTELLGHGIGRLKTGVENVAYGTGELNDAVAGLPDTMRYEVDTLVGRYDKSDFSPVSFVSEKNTNVTAVQFVLRTESIELSVMGESDASPPAQPGFWQRLLALFEFLRPC